MTVSEAAAHLRRVLRVDADRAALRVLLDELERRERALAEVVSREEQSR